MNEGSLCRLQHKRLCCAFRRVGRGLLRLWRAPHLEIIGYEQDYCSTSDCRISYIEYSIKKRMPSYQRHPFRPLPQGKVEHIYHLARQERAIALSDAYKLGWCPKSKSLGAFCENQTIETVVNHVSQSSSYDER